MEPNKSEEEKAITDEPQSEEISDSSSQEDKIDYEAVLKEEREKREKAEKAAADAAFKLRQQKREEVEEETVDEDKPLTAKELQSILARERQQTQKTLEETKALELARSLTSSEAEAQAALTYWKTRVNPTGDLQEDVTFAIAGLNYRKTVAKNAELARAVRAKDMVTTNSASTHTDAQTASEPKLAPADIQAMKAAGMNWDGTKRLYKKSLGKRTMYFDPKTKKRWTE